MNKTKIVSLIFLMLIGCKTKTSDSSEDNSMNLTKEIEALDSIEKQRKYLEAIYTIDQKVRKDATKILQQHGHDSKEHNEAGLKMNETDKINLDKIETYLRLHGHPTIEKHGDKACGAPWVVIHHSMGGTDSRRRNFKYLYKAWKDKNIDGGQFTFYLNRFYNIESGQRLDIIGSFTEKFEVDTLISLLNLEEAMKNLNQVD